MTRWLRPGPCRAPGFTLLELMVAIAIFAVLSVLAYGGLRHLLKLEEGIRNASAQAERIRFAVLMLEQDLEAAAPRSVRDALGEREPALRAGLDGELLALTRAVALVPGEAGVALRRVRYRLENGALYRDTWAELDRTPATPLASRRVVGGVAGVRLRFVDGDQWREFWPVQDGSAGLDSVPAGVEFVLEFDDGRSVRRVLAWPG